MIIKHPSSAKGKKIVVVVGAGFAGLKAAQELAHLNEVQVVVVDQRNHHLFQPLLYQVATAGLNPSDIAVPIRSQFSDSANIEVHLGKISYVDLAAKVVVADGGIELSYDYIILACGARHSYFAHPEWEVFAPGLKTIEQATEIRRRILLAFENAENEFVESEKKALLTFVIVGGGPTGVEMAGAISDISQTVLSHDFKRIDTKSAQVVLVEAGARILGSFDGSLSAQAALDLKKMGVDVRVGTRVVNIDDQGVQLSGGGYIPAKTVVWAAGVQATPLEFKSPIIRDNSGRIKVNSDFSIPQHPEAFVVGDMASFQLTEKQILPGLAPAAIQAGRHAALMIKATLHGQPRVDFKYNDKGQMATIGKTKAIAQVGNIRLTGFIAWLSWLFIHILYLVGFKNKFAVFLQWIWSYLFAKRGSRLITDKEWRL